MDEVKHMLDNYLQQYHPEIKFGTEKYNEYLVEGSLLKKLRKMKKIWN